MKRFYSITMLLLVCFWGGLTQAQQEGTVEINILHTNDEHGWMLPLTVSDTAVTQGGAANIYSWWLQKEGYTPESFLLLSGGDSWTGPAISTWFEGQPMVEAFNLMQYDASAIGNHEFDFGREVMQTRFAEAAYPYLAANIRYAESGEPVDFVLPYTLLEVQGVQVGIIGLTTQDTVSTTHPKNISDLTFTDYGEALENYVPQMRDEGAQIIIGLTHICADELRDLADAHADLVDVLLAGHCNEAFSESVNGVELVGSGGHWQSYSHITLTFDIQAEEILEVNSEMVRVEFISGAADAIAPDEQMTALIDRWQTEVQAELNEEIGYAQTGLRLRTWTMANWVTDSWLWAYPSADAAMTNWGGFRQDLDAGPITVGDVVGILPFDNTLIEIEITGAQLVENLLCCAPAVAGLIYTQSPSGIAVTFSNGKEFDSNATYKILVNDFMYLGGDGFLFSQQDPDAYNTGIHWRQPVLDYTRSFASTPEQPLEEFLNDLPRLNQPRSG